MIVLKIKGKLTAVFAKFTREILRPIKKKFWKKMQSYLFLYYLYIDKIKK